MFSDATQNGVDAADSALRETLDASGVRWDAIEVRLKGESLSFRGNGMGAVLRKDLLAPSRPGRRMPARTCTSPTPVASTTSPTTT